jgi:hypothetical protein
MKFKKRNNSKADILKILQDSGVELVKASRSDAGKLFLVSDVEKKELTDSDNIFINDYCNDIDRYECSVTVPTLMCTDEFDNFEEVMQNTVYSFRYSKQHSHHKEEFIPMNCDQCSSAA